MLQSLIQHFLATGQLTFDFYLFILLQTVKYQPGLCILEFKN